MIECPYCIFHCSTLLMIFFRIGSSLKKKKKTFLSKSSYRYLGSHLQSYISCHPNAKLFWGLALYEIIWDLDLEFEFGRHLYLNRVQTCISSRTPSITKQIIKAMASDYEFQLKDREKLGKSKLPRTINKFDRSHNINDVSISQIQQHLT